VIGREGDLNDDDDVKTFFHRWPWHGGGSSHFIKKSFDENLTFVSLFDFQESWTDLI
jgi:hypothetical protein